MFPSRRTILIPNSHTQQGFCRSFQNVLKWLTTSQTCCFDLSHVTESVRLAAAAVCLSVVALCNDQAEKMWLITDFRNSNSLKWSSLLRSISLQGDFIIWLKSLCKTSLEVRKKKKLVPKDKIYDWNWRNLWLSFQIFYFPFSLLSEQILHID